MSLMKRAGNERENRGITYCDGLILITLTTLIDATLCALKIGMYGSSVIVGGNLKS